MDLLSDGRSERRSLIASATEVVGREGVDLQRGMNFHDDGVRMSVFLVLPHEGEYTDAWQEEGATLILEGHDSVAEGARGRADDQLLMYESGRPTENGKFYKAANAFKDGLRAEPLSVQVYEKLDAGVLFDKGIFNLMDATYRVEGMRKVAKFYLRPADADLPIAERDASWSERMIPAGVKAMVWKRDDGRCAVCGSQSGLHLAADASGTIQLRCPLHDISMKKSATIG